VRSQGVCITGLRNRLRQWEIKLQQHLFRLLTAWCVVLPAMMLSAADAAKPTVDDFTRLASRISSDDSERRSIEIGGYLKNKDEKNNEVFHLTFRAIYQAPDQYAFSMYDGKDGTPLVIAADNKVFVYDPIRPAVLYFSGVKPKFMVCQEEERFQFKFGMDTKSGEVTCDIKSFLLGPRKGSAIAKDADGTYWLTLTTLRGNFCVATFDASRPSACTKLDLVKQGDEQPFLSIDKISIDGEIPVKHFTFPSKDQLSSKVKVQELLIDGYLTYSQAVALVLRAATVRSAVHDPKLRDAIKEIDWDQVKENDKTYSKALRELLVEQRP
jgi:hypothetical protein